MKLKFCIDYRTAWGESLHVNIAYYSLDGTVKRYNLMMQTEDGERWTLETAALESRQHPLSHIVYLYQVENADGEVLRHEWDMVPRIYYFDSSKDYMFPDQWRDMPLPFHLYTNAYLTMMHGRTDEHVEALRLPLFRRTLTFRVSAPQLLPGQAVAICGSHPAIGNWNTSRYLRMEYAGQQEWILTVNALGMIFPLEYKYVVVDDKTHAFVCWEEGDNRVVSVDSIDGNTSELPDGQVLMLYGEPLRLREQIWRAAGVAIPVFSLRSEHSYGVGDFGDLRRLVDWAVLTGMRVIQILPVNDTTVNHGWQDSYPYNIISVFALHPHYIDLEAAGTLKSKQKMTQYRRRQQELNALSYSDYEAVDRVKMEYLRELFEEKGKVVMDSDDFKTFVRDNEEWLKPYAEWLSQNNQNTPTIQNTQSFYFFLQFLLHQQLKAAADYARSKGVILKGDLPIGVNRESVETKEHPELFHLDSQTGAPPDAFTSKGQNWGFPTYQWGDRIISWFHKRLHHMEQYFDAIRIDHILGFFRVWEIPEDAIDGLLGHFSPSLPLTVGEIEYFGLAFRKELFTRPFINDRLIDRIFGIHAQYVRDIFLVRKAYNLYDLREDYATQRKVATAFADRRDESSLWIRDGLMRLISNVLFVEDPRQPEMYHPRIGILNEPIYEALGSEDKDAFVRLYNNYFYQRHSMYWGQQALKRLPAILKDSRMLICGEDLGMLPDCVEPVLDKLRILTLEIQQMPKQQGFEFAHLEANPYRSVSTISTHDMSPLRLWWQESPERRQRFYVTMLQKEGRAPEQLPAHLAEEIIARHLYCPSMLCILALQDWLAMDGELRSKHPQDERINVPSDPYNRWKWRMHVTIEQLIAAERYNNKVKTMITRSKRC
ncbi:MAG: 4-alpha-glucanotransferase [Prevotella sp.]|nr:4-alpha-glucanotransferase [Prevotella sp.]